MRHRTPDWRADFFNEISDAAIEVHRRYAEQLPTGHSTMHLYPIDGAASTACARTASSDLRLPMPRRAVS